MSADAAINLVVGLHRVHWKSGGSSLVAVGKQPDGRLWFAPCNWASPSSDTSAEFWSDIDHAELLYPDPPRKRGRPRLANPKSPRAAYQRDLMRRRYAEKKKQQSEDQK